MIIGVTGTHSSGKETVAGYLMKKDFIHYSLSDVIREEASKRGLPLERNILFDIGNELREKYGENILALKIFKKIQKGNFKNTVITSIRNPEEIKTLKGFPNFYLLGMDAPIELRFKRAVLRGRAENALTLQEFIKIEEKEKTKEKYKQQLGVCLNMVDKVIINGGSFEDLYKKVDDILLNLVP